ncbi:hypothetical protein [Marinibacterium sp. SX1]|uniref:hypothetical protein n=1 Tax=Marinibacterium sp. SX1 TaxID=3388424 RepID=UPI003D1841BD
MTAAQRHRGGAPVGLVADLDPVEAGLVIYLRLYCSGDDAREQAERDFTLSLGPDHGTEALESLGRICELCADHGRRPLMRHGISCKCLGADESCLANMVAAAGTGEREEAMLLAALMVRADMAPCLAGLAETLGLALARMAAMADVVVPRAAGQPVTLH